MITDPLFYLVAVPTLMITGVSKGGLGGGLGILSVPLISMTVSTTQTTGILLPIMCLMDTFGCWVYRCNWDPPNLKAIIPAGLIGIALGTAGFTFFNEQAIRFLIGIIAVSFTLHHWLGGKKAEVPAPAGRLSGFFWGTVSGFTSTVAHAGSPPLQVHLLPQRLEKSRHVGTAVIFFTIINYVKLIPYAWLGQLSPGNLATSLVLSPLAPLGIALGVYLNKRVRPEIFYRICYLVVFASGTKLLVEGIGLKLL